MRSDSLGWGGARTCPSNHSLLVLIQLLVLRPHVEQRRLRYQSLQHLGSQLRELITKDYAWASLAESLLIGQALVFLKSSSSDSQVF